MKGKVFNAQDLRIGKKVFLVTKLAMIHCKISKISNCCESSIIEETDICNQCKEHCEIIVKEV